MICGVCDEAFDTVLHYGGTATETKRAVCDGCGEEYGDLVTRPPEVSSEETPENTSETAEKEVETWSPEEIESQFNAFVDGYGCEGSFGRSVFAILAIVLLSCGLLWRKREVEHSSRG